MSSAAPHARATPRPATHPLLAGARLNFIDVRSGRDVLFLLPRKKNLVDLFVTSATLDRALKNASELFLHLEDRGQRVVFAPPGRGYVRAEFSTREGVKPAQDYGEYHRGRWQPAGPTVALVGEVAIGMTIYELTEEVDAVFRDGHWVRYEPTKPIIAPRRRAPAPPQPYVSKHQLPSGRLALHAYSAQHVTWEQTWIERKPGELATMFEHIAKAFESAAPTITKRLEERARDEERRRKEHEEQQKRWRREEEERRRKELEASRLKHLESQIAAWRMARDVRAYVTEIRDLVKEAGLSITEGGEGDQELRWALAYADRIDPVAPWRKDIDQLKAQGAPSAATSDPQPPRASPAPAGSAEPLTDANQRSRPT